VSTPDLSAVIEQLVNLGEKDPLTIVRKLEERHGADWLREQGALHAADFAADLARRLLGSQRRQAEVALRPGDRATSADLQIKSYWIPEAGLNRRRNRIEVAR
jgi:hypothetical protein